MRGSLGILSSGTCTFVHDLPCVTIIFIIPFAQDAVEIQHPATGQSTRYETFLPNRPLPYSRAACEKLQTPWISGNDSEDDVEDSSDGGALPAEQVTSFDNDDEWEDTVEHLSTGVGDILVTGKVCELPHLSIYRRLLTRVLRMQTSQKQGDAWGHFTILGRVSTLQLRNNKLIILFVLGEIMGRTLRIRPYTGM